MTNLNAVWDSTVGMGAAAFRSFLRTMVLLLCLGLALGIGTYTWLMGGLRIEPNKWCVFCAILSLAIVLECTIIGIALAAKRAVAMALIHTSE